MSAGSKLASFHVCLHSFQWNIHFVCRYVFAFINLVCVQSVTRLMNTLLKDFFISFSRVTTVKDFETVTFYVLFVYKPTFSVIFCWIKKVRVSRKFNSLFILYISTAKPISRIRGILK